MPKPKNENRSGRLEPVDIKTMLADVCRKRKWQQRLDLHAVFQLWDELVGEDIAAQAQPSLVRGQVLWVKVADSVWMQQLHLQKLLLLETINQRLTDTGFTDIRFQFDAATGSRETSPPVTEQETVRPPTQEKVRAFETLISPLQDEEIKRALRNLWVTLNSTRS